MEQRGVSKTQTSKTQTPDPKNSDPKNSDPRVSRKLRPENSDPLGVSKIKHIYTAWMPQADLFTVRRYRGITNICREKKKQLIVLDTYNDHELSAEKRKKQLAVLDTCNNHEN